MSSGEIDRETLRLVGTFNRQLTRRLRLLRRKLSGPDLHMAQENILCGIFRHESKSWLQSSKSLLIHMGLLSRNLKALEELHLINRVRSRKDNRKYEFVMTKTGKKVAAAVKERADQRIGESLQALERSEIALLLTGLIICGRVMGLHMEEARFSLHIRPHRIGCTSYVTFLHETVYSEEYGLDWTFAVEVGREITGFIRQFDPKLDGFWVAEADSHLLGAIVIVHGGSGVRTIALVHGTPGLSPSGSGGLMTYTGDFCKDRQYKEVFLWTFDELHAAIHLYRSFGFERTRTNPHLPWGHNLTEDRYELDLKGQRNSFGTQSAL